MSHDREQVQPQADDPHHIGGSILLNGHVAIKLGPGRRPLQRAFLSGNPPAWAATRWELPQGGRASNGAVSVDCFGGTARAKHPGVSLEHLIQQRPAVDPLTSVEEAVRLMTENAVGAVPVTKGGKLLGIFTERDLMSRVVMSRKDPVTTPVSAVMTSPVLTIEATATIEEAAAVMQSRHIRHLAIVDEQGDLKGLVALRYLLFEKLGGLERKVDDLEAFIMTDGPGG